MFEKYVLRDEIVTPSGVRLLGAFVVWAATPMAAQITARIHLASNARIAGFL